MLDKTFKSAEDIDKSMFVRAGLDLIVLDDKARMDWLKDRAREFLSRAEQSHKTGDITPLLGVGVPKDSARRFLEEAKGNFDFALEKLEIQEFSLLVQGKGEWFKMLTKDRETRQETLDHVMGFYDKETLKMIKKSGYYEKMNYENDLKEKLSEKPSTKHAKNDKYYTDKLEEIRNIDELFEGDPKERLSTFGIQEGEGQPVCRHYAPVVAIMLQEGSNHDKPYYAFSNSVIGSDRYSDGGHMSIISSLTGNIPEPTVKDPRAQAYNYFLAAEGKNGIATNPVKALQEGGRVMVTDGDRVRIYSTHDFDDKILEEVASRYASVKVKEYMQEHGNEGLRDYATKMLEVSRKENSDTMSIDLPEVREFAKEEIKDIRANPIKIPGRVLYNLKEFAQREDKGNTEIVGRVVDSVAEDNKYTILQDIGEMSSTNLKFATSIDTYFDLSFSDVGHYFLPIPKDFQPLMDRLSANQIDEKEFVEGVSASLMNADREDAKKIAENIARIVSQSSVSDMKIHAYGTEGMDGKKLAEFVKKVAGDDKAAIYTSRAFTISDNDLDEHLGEENVGKVGLTKNKSSHRKAEKYDRKQNGEDYEVAATVIYTDKSIKRGEQVEAYQVEGSHLGEEISLKDQPKPDFDSIDARDLGSIAKPLQVDHSK